jgi:hypothetical protein
MRRSRADAPPGFHWHLEKAGLTLTRSNGGNRVGRPWAPGPFTRAADAAGRPRLAKDLPFAGCAVVRVTGAEHAGRGGQAVGSA